MRNLYSTMNPAEEDIAHSYDGEIGLVSPKDFRCDTSFEFERGQSIPEVTLRYETYGSGVRVTNVAPGFVGEGTEFAAVRNKGDMAKAAATYDGFDELRASDIACQLLWALRQSERVWGKRIDRPVACHAQQSGRRDAYQAGRMR